MKLDELFGKICINPLQTIANIYSSVDIRTLSDIDLLHYYHMLCMGVSEFAKEKRKRNL